MFYRLLFALLYFFLLAIVLSVLLRFPDSDYPFATFKLFLYNTETSEVSQISITNVITEIHHCYNFNIL